MVRKFWSPAFRNTFVTFFSYYKWLRAAIIALDSMNLVHHFLVIVLLLIIPWAAPLSFNFPTFQQSDLTNGTGLLITEGDAVIAYQSIHPTKDNVGGETTHGSVGRATYSEPFLLRDNATRKLQHKFHN
ncbi:hypothetical protein ACFX1T_007673 [Malus domestica]